MSVATNVDFIKWFDQINIDDVPIVGGKNASLGEMYRELAVKGVKIPNGFATTADAYRMFLGETGLDEKIIQILADLDTSDVSNLRRRVQEEMKKHGLVRGENGLEIYVMSEIPSNVIAAEAFAEIFDGFSIGSNDLTQLTLGVDRDSEIVAHVFNERDPAVMASIKTAIAAAKKTNRKIGICGQAPSDYPDFAQFLVEEGIDSISLIPDAVLMTTLKMKEIEES